MTDSVDFLQAFALVLCVAAVTTVLFQKLRQPVVLGYILAGLLIGPHLPVPLVADPHVIHTLSELGIILLMFSLGLEFSLRRLIKVGPAAAVTAVVQCSLMLWLGFTAGRAFGWTTIESLFAGAIVSVSSTTIIAKVFEEQGVKGRLRELVIGVLVVEDLVAILLMAGLTAVGSGEKLSFVELMKVSGRLVAFLAAVVGVGMLVVPRLLRMVARMGRPETTLIAAVGVCFGVALLAHTFGYSVALGAFIAGSLVSESGHEPEIQKLVVPVRDLFAAVFFVSVGMMLDPKILVQYWPAILVFTSLVVVGKFVGVAIGAFLTGSSTPIAVRAGMSLAQIGEFSFIIAGLGLTQKSTGDFLYPIAIAVSALTTLLTPWLIRASAPVARWIDRHLPAPLQTFVALYGSWIERLLGPSERGSTTGRAVRRLFRLLASDAVVLAFVVIGTALGLPRAAAFLARQFSVDPKVAHGIVLVIATLLALPFAGGLVRVSRKLGTMLADLALPGVATGAVDLVAAPRRALVVTLQLACFLLVGAPLVAITQPFLSGFQGAEVLVVVLVIVGIAFWKSATNLEGHVRAGAQVIVEALAAGSQPSGENSAAHTHMQGLLDGLGAPVAIEVTEDSPAVGRTLAELDLRASTGATVLAITHPDATTSLPSAHQPLTKGDVLAIAGPRDAVDAARRILRTT